METFDGALLTACGEHTAVCPFWDFESCTDVCDKETKSKLNEDRKELIGNRDITKTLQTMLFFYHISTASLPRSHCLDYGLQIIY